MSGGGACQRICESRCIDEVLTPMEIAQCVEACEMGGSPLDGCLPETASFLECVERFNCEGDLQCLDEATAFLNCIQP